MMIPSIDLMDGRPVQLRRGAEKVLERDDPFELARQFDRCSETAVIDLDAAMGHGNNLDIIKELCRITDCRVGGGVRTVEDARRIIDDGAVRVIIGSKAFEYNTVNHEFLKELVSELDPCRIIIAIDARNGSIVTKAWAHDTGLDLFDTVRELEEYCGGFLYTCVEKEGCLQGTDMERIRKLRSLTDNDLTVAGGITTLEEIREISALGADVQLGMALYTGKIGLEEGWVESLDWSKGDLLPTVAQDPDGHTLMLAYSSKASLLYTLETGSMTYWSRSRKELWTKGKTSGNTQKLVRLRADCDRDAILAVVEQKGAACHTGHYSCFTCTKKGGGNG